MNPVALDILRVDGARSPRVRVCTLRFLRLLATSMWLVLPAACRVQVGNPADLAGVAQPASARDGLVACFI